MNSDRLIENQAWYFQNRIPENIAKPTDKHQYLLMSSCHPNHTKHDIPFSRALQLGRICSTDIFFHKHCGQLIDYLVKQGYSHSFLKKGINGVSTIPCHETLKPQETKLIMHTIHLSLSPALPNATSTE